MQNKPTPQHYRPAQKILHWVVVFGFIAQIAIHEFIVRAHEALTTGETPNTTDELFAWLHVGIGTTILLAVVARLYLRFKHGAPGPAPGTTAQQAKMANIMHWLLYALLLAMVVTGMITWNGLAQLGDIHFYLNILLFVLVVGHAGAAIYNQFVRKDGTLRRMLAARDV